MRPFLGEHTNAVHLYAKTEDDEEIWYVDYISLHPWVNKNCIYPIGHPVTTTPPQSNNISGYFGWVKCTVIPPHNLYHPILPYRCKGKLTFPLCQTCVKKELDNLLMRGTPLCPHNPEERVLTSTWCPLEV